MNWRSTSEESRLARERAPVPDANDTGSVADISQIPRSRIFAASHRPDRDAPLCTLSAQLSSEHSRQKNNPKNFSQSGALLRVSGVAIAGEGSEKQAVGGGVFRWRRGKGCHKRGVVGQLWRRAAAISSEKNIISTRLLLPLDAMY